MNKLFYCLCIIFPLIISLLFSCGNGSLENDNITHPKNSDLTEKEVDNTNSLPKANWRNPFMTPMGVNIARIIRGYYLVGEYEKMLQFVVVPKCYELEELTHILRKSKWGYEIKANNLKWQSDSTFILSINFSKQQTIGQEQYIGKIVNDTAKLFLFPEKEDLFPYFGDEVLDNPCEIKETMDNIQFVFNSAIFLPESKSDLKKLLKILNNKSDYKAYFTGYTSDEGSAEYNLNLSIQRAKAIYDYLIKNGIPKNRLYYDGKGFSEPLFPNTTESNKAKNRRVEIRLTRIN